MVVYLGHSYRDKFKKTFSAVWRPKKFFPVLSHSIVIIKINTRMMEGRGVVALSILFRPMFNSQLRPTSFHHSLFSSLSCFKHV